MSNVAIIPARGGSKGIPHKNVTLLCGKPLIAWTIEAARAARHVNRVVVSTDSPEIAEVARQFGAEVVMRPEVISGDMASSEAALLHTLDQLQRREDFTPELVVFLQCTSPLTAPEDIDGTIEALYREEADTALAVVDFHYFVWKPDFEGGAVGVNHDKRVRLLRQQREPEYLETGAVYVMRAAGFRESKHRFFGRTALYVIPAERRLEIDDPTDLKVAEVLMRARQQKDRLACLPVSIGAVVFDFDGVFTDNRVLVDEEGVEGVFCNRSDGWGLAELKRRGVPLLVLSTEENRVVSARCRKLGLECLQGQKDKFTALTRWLQERSISPAHVVYVGNDVNDLQCLEQMACGIVVADAHADVRAAASLVLDSPGGRGAVREVTDLILQAITGESSNGEVRAAGRSGDRPESSRLHHR